MVMSVKKPPDPRKRSQSVSVRKQMDGHLTVFNEKALVLSSRGRAHHDLDILDTSSLSYRPVDSRRGSCCCNGSEIQFQISNLPEKHVRRSPARISTALVLVTINHTQTRETSSSLDHRD